MSSAAHWWDHLPPEDQERLDRIARESIIDGLQRMPRDYTAMLEILAWQQLEVDVLEAHTDWLARTKARFERNGWPWTVEELARRSHLWEHE